MRIGRLEFGIAIGFSQWACYKAQCGCCFLDLGRVYFTWLDKNCKCGVCRKYECECPDIELKCLAHEGPNCPCLY